LDKATINLNIFITRKHKILHYYKNIVKLFCAVITQKDNIEKNILY